MKSPLNRPKPGTPPRPRSIPGCRPRPSPRSVLALLEPAGSEAGSAEAGAEAGAGSPDAAATSAAALTAGAGGAAAGASDTERTYSLCKKILIERETQTACKNLNF